MGSGPGGRGGGARCGGEVTRKEAAAEAYQRLFDIVKQTWPRGRTRFLTGNHDIVDACDTKPGQERPYGFPHAATGAVADDGAADLFGRGKADPGRVTRHATAARLNHHQAAAFGITLCNIKKFATNAEAFDDEWRWVGVVRAG
jgi:hypothetical protein